MCFGCLKQFASSQAPTFLSHKRLFKMQPLTWVFLPHIFVQWVAPDYGADDTV